MTPLGSWVDALGMERLDAGALSAPDRELLAAAEAVADAAHNPYSRVRVGAALRSASGDVWSGCNVENASYGLTICAERSACVAAVSAGNTTFEAIAIWSDRSLMPCGACRQFLAEFAPRLRVVVGGAGAEVVLATLDELLPSAFRSSDLGS